MATDERHGGLLRVAHGPLAVEERLLADLDERARAIAGDPRALGRALTLVVPSESLRLHLAARCVRSRGRALAGLRVSTLQGVASRLLERALAPPQRGAACFAILVRRLARAEAALARDLEHFEDGYQAVVASASDFLDAGYDVAHSEALLEVLADAQSVRSVDQRTLERARALVRTVQACAHEMHALGLEHRSGVLLRATAALERDPMLLDGEELWIRGFADATGRAADFIERLTRAGATRVYVDTATIPPGADARAFSFGQRLRERLAIEEPGDELGDAPRAPTPALLRAPGPEAEVRAVAQRIHALLERGVAPESIGLVARDLEPLRLAIRRSFTRLAVPYSGLSARGSPGPAERRVGALFDVLRESERALVERWFDACASVTGQATGDGDLLLALRSLGAARLDALADLDLSRAPLVGDRFALPVRRGSWSVDEESPIAPAAAAFARRSVTRTTLERARDAARGLCDALERWPARAPIPVHVDALRALVSRELGWTSTTAGAAALEALLDGIAREPGDGLAREPGAALALERAEFLRLVLDSWREQCGPPLGGAGSGVQCLTVVEARARTFEHLFVMGLNRGAFPRQVREDPLLPDALRVSLASVLPDLPLKSLGHEEERALFDELLHASPHITLSWQTIDEDGRPREPSPFVESLVAFGALGDVEIAAPVFGVDSARMPRWRPAHEELVLAGIAGERARYAQLLPIAIADARARAGWKLPSADELARAALAISSELDQPAYARPGLTPYFGLVGPRRGANDPRQGEVYVTTLESLAECAWRTFLVRLLRVEQPPDPLESLPAIDARMLGDLVHRVLHALVATTAAPRGDTLAHAAERAPRPIAWPDAAAVDALLRSHASEIVREEGFVLPGLAHVLAAEARPFLVAARALDAADPSDGVSGSELRGVVDLPSVGRAISFIVDRVERTAQGLRLTDFKTGKPYSEHKTVPTRAKHLTARIENGRMLQAAAYALAGRPGAEGRYVYLGPHIDDVARVAQVSADDAERRAAFERTTATLIRALDEGVFLPRLLDDKLEREHRHCATCEVADACLRGDSGARERLADWVQRATAESAHAPVAFKRADPSSATMLRAAIDLWRLGASEPDEHGDAST